MKSMERMLYQWNNNSVMTCMKLIAVFTDYIQVFITFIHILVLINKNQLHFEIMLTYIRICLC